ncbi:hypothetical protein DM02DRAFT_704141 [Periconia macrospinosa]|uniref:Integral membrane protein n=1 Tax=Periconia macrospinosa TaxID=97972 RepID=A0A2V1DTY2_9PLEO|nr:hypothetical protein DM02DRAFT_704141 [Periconia macrospinosa]
MQNHTVTSTMKMTAATNSTSYFRLVAHRDVMIAHIILMTSAWAIFLPVAVMLSISNSPTRIPVQLIFTLTNAFGALLGAVFSHQTPELYAGQKHSPVGWVGIVSSIVWLALTVVPKDDVKKSSYSENCQLYRQSYEALLRSSHSSSSESEHEYAEDDLDSIPEENTDKKLEQPDRLSAFTARAIYSKAMAWMASKYPLQALQILRAIFDRTILVLGFICIVTGVIVFSGSFRGIHVFNGLAHSIKGGIFFWYGLLTFGRWLGCLADFGWAWNQRPGKAVVGSRAARMPSMEFFESATMCFYGVTNVWLEHLSNTDGAWRPRDLEHVAIAFLFFGGGLVGMLINSVSLRKLTMAHLRSLINRRTNTNTEADQEASLLPDQLQLSINPIPAILLFLLGFMMSSHHQPSKISTMLHMLWGRTFMVAAFSRLATYAILYLRPPTSCIPPRPPTELVASFCIIAGGLLLMLSNTSTIEALEYHNLDAMFIFTNVVGLTAIVMAWEAVCLAIKGWGLKQ